MSLSRLNIPFRQLSKLIFTLHPHCFSKHLLCFILHEFYTHLYYPHHSFLHRHVYGLLFIYCLHHLIIPSKYMSFAFITTLPVTRLIICLKIPPLKCPHNFRMQISTNSITYLFKTFPDPCALQHTYLSSLSTCLSQYFPYFLPIYICYH